MTEEERKKTEEMIEHLRVSVNVTEALIVELIKKLKNE
jgi:hypothetical protein